MRTWFDTLSSKGGSSAALRKNAVFPRKQRVDVGREPVIAELALEESRLARIMGSKDDLKTVVGDNVAQHIKNGRRVDEVMMLGWVIEQQRPPVAPSIIEREGEQERKLDLRALSLVRDKSDGKAFL
jgi:hypothetical protein